jgi:hypothetical protein
LFRLNLALWAIFERFICVRRQVWALTSFKYRIKPIITFEVKSVAKAAKKKEKKPVKKK